MEGFQKFVLYAAIFVLILALIFIGLSLSHAKNPVWPPVVPNCPDYWVVDGSGNNTKCINVKDLCSIRHIKSSSFCEQSNS